MDAAFVDIGIERNAFLYVGDVLPTSEDSGSLDSAGSGDSRARFGKDRRRGGRPNGAPPQLPGAPNSAGDHSAELTNDETQDEVATDDEELTREAAEALAD